MRYLETSSYLEWNHIGFPNQNVDVRPSLNPSRLDSIFTNGTGLGNLREPLL